MAVTDPLIKELKGYTATFLEAYKNNEIIKDSDTTLALFCACLERILNLGIVSVANSFGFIRHNDPWTWMEKVAASKYQAVSYNFTNAVDNARVCKNVFTNVGRCRLVVRYCLARKCLHVPVEYMDYGKALRNCTTKTRRVIISRKKNTKELTAWHAVGAEVPSLSTLSTGKISDYYEPNSILGDEILSEILLSVLYQCSKISFKLDVLNTAFLDLSWLLPEILRVELVPSLNLGMSVSFSGDKAIIIQMRSNSVVAECTKIAVGDVLDTLNGICICSATKGRLSSLLKCQKGRPINLTIVKAIYSHNLQFYQPMLRLYKDVDLDPDEVKSKVAKTREEHSIEEVKGEKTVLKKKQSSGFRSIYVGSVDVGKVGDVKLIDKAFNMLFSVNSVPNISKCKKFKREVHFEVGELGVRCFDKITGEMLLKNSFMEISACGSVMLMPNYFSYITGDENCSTSKNFMCYIFMAPDDETAYTILQGIGQGFQRTHFAV